MPLRLLVLAAVLMFLPACTRSLPKYEKPIARTQFQRVRTTAYTHTESDHRCHGCQTAIGTTLRYDTIHSAAADWSRWPLGTVFRVIGTGEVCEVDDIGWAISGRNTIDLYKPSGDAMNHWGTRIVDIEILRWGSDEESLAILSKRSRHPHVRRMLDDLKANASKSPTPEPAVAMHNPEVPVRVEESAGDGDVPLVAFRRTLSR
jgi:3D (Asp-Asp-Asp) domain-containing protein